MRGDDMRTEDDIGLEMRTDEMKGDDKILYNII